MTAPLRAVVIGLGQVAWRFDEEPGRKSVWSHVGAYRALADRFDIVGVSDPSDEARKQFFTRHAGIPAFSDVGELMRETKPDVVSICSPSTTHRDVLENVLANNAPKAIWCEKPLATSVSDGTTMVQACKDRGTRLVISHARRWSPLWRSFRDGMRSDIGTLRSLRVAMPNRLWSIGSHAADLLCWLGGPIENTVALAAPALTEDSEPAVAALATFDSGAFGVLQVTGRKAGLIVEAEAIGDRGRLVLREDRGEIRRETFVNCSRYEGYEELTELPYPVPTTDPSFSTFTEIANEIWRLATGEQTRATCDGAAALAVLNLLDRLAATATEGETAKVANG